MRSQRVRGAMIGLVAMLTATSTGACSAGTPACGDPRRGASLASVQPDGVERWRSPIPATGSRALVDRDSIVVVGDGSGRKGEPGGSVGIDAATGAQRWSVPVAGAAVAIVDGWAWVSAPSQLLALDPRTGDTGWTAEASSARRFLGGTSVLSTDGTVVTLDPTNGHVVRSIGDVDSAAPAGVTRIAVLARGDSLEAIDATTGATIWTVPVPGADATYPVDSVHPVDSVRATTGAVMVVLHAPTGPDRRVVVLDAATGRHRFTVDGVRNAQLEPGVLLTDQRAVADDGGAARQLAARDPVNGAVRWTVPTTGVLGGFTTVADGRALFATTAGGLSIDAVLGPPAGTRLDGAFVAADDSDRGDVGLTITTGSGDPDQGGVAMVVPPDDRIVTSVAVDTGRARWTDELDHHVVGLSRGPSGDIVITSSDQVFGCM